MASLTLLQRIVLGIGIIAFVTLGLFAPWNTMTEAGILMMVKDNAIMDWLTEPAGRHLIFFPPEKIGLRLAVDRLAVEWLIVVVLTIGSVLILKQNQTRGS